MNSGTLDSTSNSATSPLSLVLTLQPENNGQKLFNYCVSIGDNLSHLKRKVSTGLESCNLAPNSMTALSLLNDADKNSSSENDEWNSTNSDLLHEIDQAEYSPYSYSFRDNKQSCQRKDLMTTVDSINMVRSIPWGKFKGVVDDRMARCYQNHHNDRNYDCSYCGNLPIVPSKLKQLVKYREVIMKGRHVPRRKSFSNLSFQYNCGDENLPLGNSEKNNENDVGHGGNYTFALRKKFHHYKELNGLKLRKHIGSSRSENSEN